MDHALFRGATGAALPHGIIQYPLGDSLAVFPPPDLSATIGSLIVNPRYAVDHDQSVGGITHGSTALVLSSVVCAAPFGSVF
jgi:hypothetical protein